MTRVLALDTTTRAGSIALVEDGRIVDEQSGDASRTYAERLPEDILRLVERHGIALPDVDLYGVAAGPGSFTGMRIGIATIQGLAFVHRRRVAAISALAALAHLAAREVAEGAVVAAWMDAHRGEVFNALYRVTSAHAPWDARRLAELADAAVGDPVSTLMRITASVGGEPILFVGDGAVTYGDRIRLRRPGSRIMEAPRLAGVIGLMAVAEAASGHAVDPSAVRPLYVRRPDAELDRERRAAPRTKETMDTNNARDTTGAKIPPEGTDGEGAKAPVP
jgi:tRNA threonylcarbamoyladenosine biosynthesis protein TsaB